MTHPDSILLLHIASSLRFWGRIIPQCRRAEQALLRIAGNVAKLEHALDEIVAIAEDEARMAECAPNVVPFLGRVR